MGRITPRPMTLERAHRFSGQGRGRIFYGVDIMLFDRADLNVIGGHQYVYAGFTAGRAFFLANSV